MPTCQRCGEDFEAKQIARARYCSVRCRVAAHRVRVRRIRLETLPGLHSQDRRLFDDITQASNSAARLIVRVYLTHGARAATLAIWAAHAALTHKQVYNAPPLDLEADDWQQFDRP